MMRFVLLAERHNTDVTEPSHAAPVDRGFGHHPQPVLISAVIFFS
jgi:hypothetical protein